MDVDTADVWEIEEDKEGCWADTAAEWGAALEVAEVVECRWESPGRGGVQEASEGIVVGGRAESEDLEAGEGVQE